MLTSATREETLTPNPNECHSMLTSDIRGIYPYPPYLYIYIYIYCLGIEYDFKYSPTESMDYSCEQSMVELWLVVERGHRRTTHIVLGKIIFSQCIVFCVGAELNRRDQV